MDTQGRTLAYRSNVFLSSRFMEGWPAAIGVFRGPKHQQPDNFFKKTTTKKNKNTNNYKVRYVCRCTLQADFASVHRLFGFRRDHPFSSRSFDSSHVPLLPLNGNLQVKKKRKEKKDSGHLLKGEFISTTSL